MLLLLLLPLLLLLLGVLDFEEQFVLLSLELTLLRICIKFDLALTLLVGRWTARMLASPLLHRSCFACCQDARLFGDCFRRDIGLLRGGRFGEVGDFLLELPEKHLEVL